MRLGLFYAAMLCLFAFLILINFNWLTIILAIGSMLLAFTYPLMKRFTYWPQLFLGITYNFGLILGWVSIKNTIDLIPIIFYIGAIFWTLGYDTVYGFQDIEDDEIIGVKSTSIKFKNNAKNFLIVCYSFFILFVLTMGYLMNFNTFFYIGLIFIFAHLFLYQVKLFNPKDTNSCLKIFQSNNLIGILIIFNILIGKI